MNFNRIKSISPIDDPPLTRWVNGVRASDIEERFARSLRKAKIEFSFQVPVATAFSLPGEDKVVDFLDHTNRLAIEVDGQIGHRTASQKGKTVVRDTVLNPLLNQMGYSTLKHIEWWKMTTQELTDRAQREL